MWDVIHKILMSINRKPPWKSQYIALLLDSHDKFIHISLTWCQVWILRVSTSLLQSHLCGILLRGMRRKNVEKWHPSFVRAPNISVSMTNKILFNVVLTMRLSWNIFECVYHICAAYDIRTWNILLEVRSQIFNIRQIHIFEPMNVLKCMASYCCNNSIYHTAKAFTAVHTETIKQYSWCYQFLTIKMIRSEIKV